MHATIQTSAIKYDRLADWTFSHWLLLERTKWKILETGKSPFESFRILNHEFSYRSSVETVDDKNIRRRFGGQCGIRELDKSSPTPALLFPFLWGSPGRCTPPARHMEERVGLQCSRPTWACIQVRDLTGERARRKAADAMARENCGPSTIQWTPVRFFCTFNRRAMTQRVT